MEQLDALRRRKRYARQPSGTSLRLGQLDLDILQLLYRYRYLRSTTIIAFFPDYNSRHIQKRLGDLYHEGDFIERPGQQWEAINARYMPAVYELSERGEKTLAVHGLLTENSPMLHRGRGQGFYYHHELMISDILSSIQLATKEKPRFISWQEILLKAPQSTQTAPNPFEIPVAISHTINGKLHRSDKPLIPDALFGLEYPGASYRFFVLEADRDNEPLTRTNLSQSSFMRKILQYREIITRRAYQSHWGIPNLFVLTVTTSPERMRNLLLLTEGLAGKTAPAFLYKTMPSLASFEKAPPPTAHIVTESCERCAPHEPLNIGQ
jgi:hypothetical protein